jgi:hypothetical protein
VQLKHVQGIRAAELKLTLYTKYEAGQFGYECKKFENFIVKHSYMARPISEFIERKLPDLISTKCTILAFRFHFGRKSFCQTSLEMIQRLSEALDVSVPDWWIHHFSISETTEVLYKHCGLSNWVTFAQHLLIKNGMNQEFNRSGYKLAE